MIEEIEISNFRAFSKPVKIRFRPITVLIGKNSAGKSTLIKFLLMLRQSLETSEGDFLITEGRHVELGALSLQQNTNPSFQDSRLAFEISIRAAAGPSAIMVALLDSLRAMTAERDQSSKLNLSISKLEAVKTLETNYRIKASMNYQRRGIGQHVVTCKQEGRAPLEIGSKSLKDIRFLSFATTTTRPEGELEALVNNGFVRPPREFLLEARHISPVRQESQRVVALTNAPEDEVGHQGEFAIQLLHRILTKEGKSSEFLTRHLQAVANIDNLQFEQQTEQLLSRFQGRNLDTMATCHLNDFGFGVSQCLPVLVQGTILKKGQLLIVEQPEAQVHPTAQLELGSFFVDLWREKGVPSLIETHSANIILRLRQLVSNNLLSPEDVTIAYFTTENQHVVVRNLDLYRDGRMEKGLPREFFGADVLELAKFGVPE